MKHYFIINPTAGKKDSSKYLVEEIERAFVGVDDYYQIYITSGPKDATQYVKAVCETLDQPATFYACGGDGTINEVVNGIIDSPYAHLGIVPVGSCNDFNKSLPNAPFLDIRSQIEGSVMLVDVIKVNDVYTLNVANIGFDANVSDDCNRIKGKIGVKLAYNLAIVHNLLWKMKSHARVYVDGEELSDGVFLLMVAANGTNYGGSYTCAPKAIVNDGLLDFCLVKKVSRFQFVRFIKYYKDGSHVDHPETKGLVFYQKAKNIKVIARKPISVCLDGDDYKMKEIDISVVPNKIKLIIPKNKSNVKNSSESVSEN